MKEKIIESAVKLFNEFGIKQTSFRDIATDLNVSDGHVRYYFKTKESLLLAIFEQMDQEILLKAQEVPLKGNAHTTIFRNKIAEVFTIMVRYSFFFIESPKIYNLYSALRASYKSLIEDRKDLFLNTFQSLIAIGYFKETFTQQIQEQVFYSIFILSDSWIRYFQILHNKPPIEEDINFHSNLVLQILSPYLAEL